MKAATSTAKFYQSPLLCMSARTSQLIHSPSQQQLHATSRRPATLESHMCIHARRHGCEEDSRVLDVQHCFVWEVNVEGHGGGCCDDICSVLLFQALMEHLHVQQTQKPASHGT